MLAKYLEDKMDQRQIFTDFAIDEEFCKGWEYAPDTYITPTEPEMDFETNL